MKILLDEGIEAIPALINTCRSNSGIGGKELRKAHYDLGRIMGSFMKKDIGEFHPGETTVLCMMRSGLCFGLGISDVIDCSIIFLDEKQDLQWCKEDANYCNQFIASNLPHIRDRTIIIVDAVLNTGRSLISVLDKIEPFANEVVVAVNVVQEKAKNVFDGWRAYAIRSSSNEFIGANVMIQKDGKGPDTGDRLFKTIISSK